MDTRSLLTALAVLLIVLCGNAAAQSEKENLKVKLTDQWVELVGEDSMKSFPVDSTIINREAYLIFTVPVIPPAGRGARQFTPIVVNAHVTKRGNVKRAWIVTSESPYFNKSILKAVVQYKYSPRFVDGKPQDTLVTIAVPLPR